MLITAASNGQMIDGQKQVITEGIQFEPDTEGITLKNFVLRKKHGIRLSGKDNVISSCDIDVGGDGIYILPNSVGHVIRSCAITAEAVGIYIGSGASHNTIKFNHIEHCGKWHTTKFLPFPRYGLNKREGIAIDGATDNIVAENVIKNCGLAGVTLYRNCGEFGSPIPISGADRNTINYNTISGCPIPVWEKAREWRDMVSWDCSCSGGKWVPRNEVPTLPFQQWFNLSCVTYAVAGKTKFRFPFRNKLWIVPDYASDNIIHDNDEWQVNDK